MRHKFLVLTVKKLLKLVCIYGSYRKIKTGLSLFLDHPVYTDKSPITKEITDLCISHGSKGLLLLMLLVSARML